MSLITCPSCGAAISESAKFCPNCGATISYTVNNQQNKPACPETYLARAIVVTIICCWPFGIPAIVNAVGVSNNEFLNSFPIQNRLKRPVFLFLGA